MNERGATIDSRVSSSPYEIYGELRYPFVNDTRLDLLLVELSSQSDFAGLISPWLPSFASRPVSELAWGIGDCPRVRPILWCPDDRDLFCTTVVAEVERRGGELLWNRVGLLREHGDSSATGVIDEQQVDWFEYRGFVFSFDRYRATLRDFAEEMEGDEWQLEAAERWIEGAV